MRWISRSRRPSRPAPDAREAALPWAPGGANAIQDRLEQEGFPWRLTGRELAARFGEGLHPAYRDPLIPVAPAPFGLDRLLYPFAPRAYQLRRRDQVPLAFAGHVRTGADDMASLRHAHDRIAARFGPAPIVEGGNIVFARWRAGPASVSATIWPARLQIYPGRNDAHERDPRLETACHVVVETGFRRPMSAEERGWLASAAPLAAVSGVGAAPDLATLAASQPTEASPAFLREPTPETAAVLGRIALSADGAGLILCARELHVIPMERVEALELVRLLPAKGGGGAWVSLLLRADGAGGGDRLTVSEHRETHALDAFAADLAAALNRPLRSPEPQYDY